MTPPPTMIIVLGEVAVDDGGAVDGDLGRGGRLGAGGDEGTRGLVDRGPAGVGDLDVGGVFKAGHADQHLDVVARELGLGDVNLGLDDVLNAEGEVRHGDAFLHAVVHAVDGLVVVAGEVEHGLAHGLGGDGSGVDAGAADDLARLDERDALAHLGGEDGGALAGGAGSDHDEVVGDRHGFWESLLAGIGCGLRPEVSSSAGSAGPRLVFDPHHSPSCFQARFGRGETLD
jgi:hypothetical protein